MLTISYLRAQPWAATGCRGAVAVLIAALAVAVGFGAAAAQTGSYRVGDLTIEDGLVRGEVVLVTEATQEDLQKYAGKLKGKWILTQAAPDVAAV